MEIKEGMYVRTKHYGIFKILKIIKEKDKLWFLKKLGHQVFISDKNNPIEEEIIGEPNYYIEDLIDPRDVLLLYDVENDEDYKSEVIADSQNNLCVVNYDVDRLINLRESLFMNIVKIKTIVTKEQFSQMEYRIGE